MRCRHPVQPGTSDDVVVPRRGIAPHALPVVLAGQAVPKRAPSGVAGHGGGSFVQFSAESAGHGVYFTKFSPMTWYLVVYNPSANLYDW